MHYSLKVIGQQIRPQLASSEKYSSTTRVSAPFFSVALSSGPIVVTHKKVIIMKKNSSEGHKKERDHFPCVMSPLTAHRAGHSIRHLRGAWFLPRRNMIQILSKSEPTEVRFPEGIITVPYYVRHPLARTSFPSSPILTLTSGDRTGMNTWGVNLLILFLCWIWRLPAGYGAS